MPKIAAAIGVFAAIAICIFINIKRYPAVWEMVGTSPWFTPEANTSPQDSSPQPIEIAEKAALKKPLPAPQPPPERRVPRTPPSLKPQLGNRSIPATDLWVDSSAGESSTGSRDAKTSQTPAVKTPTAQTSAYQGLNPSPIKVPGGAAGNWPAEMLPKMKYAAKPPLLESYQQWNPQRPVVPVLRPEEDEKKDEDKPAEGKTGVQPDPEDSSKIESAKQTDTPAQSDKKAVVRRLPLVDPRRRPIRMSIQGGYSEKPIPVYPDTGS